MKNSLWILLFYLFLCPTTYGQYVHTDGTRIVDENGEDLYFYGMNLGNWLLWEGYLMMGDFNYRTHTQFLNSVSTAFGNDMTKAKEFEHQWRMNYVTEKAMADLKALGFNSVRVPFHYNMFWDGSNVKDDGFQYFDRVIEYCKANDMYVLLDMHAAPGYQNPGDHSDNVNSNASQPRETVTFWDGNNVNIASAVWRHIANKYKNEPTIWGYDLINEPVPQPGREFELLGSMITMRNAIREVDNNHIIVAEGTWWGSDMQKFDWLDVETQNQSGYNSRWDNNLVYQTHHYSTDVSQLDGRLAICNKLNVPMILGEYGESDMGNLRNMTDWCINNNVDYFPWSFKKMSHDKCLWTIQPNNAYNELKNAINSNTTGPSSLYSDMISFCQNNIANGSAGLVWHQDFYDAVKPNTPPCTVDIPTSFTATDITASSIKLTWTDASNEVGYTISCSNGQSVELLANTTSYTFSGLSESTSYTFAISSFDNECSSTDVTTSATTICSGAQTPYLGAAATIPGTIEGENFDEGCAAYNELTDGNSGGEYRDGDVDITSGSNGSYAIGWIDEGEWLEYTVNVQQAGTYEIDYTVASPESTGQIQLQIASVTKATMAVPNTGDWGNYQTETISNVSLDAGTQVIRLVFSGALNFDKLEIKEQGEASYLQSITISPLTGTIYLGESLDFNAEGFDQFGDAYPISESWSSTGGTIDGNGLFTSSTIGTYYVTVSDQGVSASASIEVVEIPPCTPNIPGIIEAENYSNMAGIQTESTSDDGGGTNVGWIDAGDWIEYADICVETISTYNVEVRIASESSGGQFEIQDQNNTVLATIYVPVSGGWQSWVSVNETLTLSNSTTALKLVVIQGGFNINWLNFTIDDGGDVVDVTDVALTSTSLSLKENETSNLTETVSPSNATNKTVSWSSDNTLVATVSSSGLVTAIAEGIANITVVTADGGFKATCVVNVSSVVDDPTTILIQAEDYFEMYGIQTEGTSDDEGGQNVGWIDGGDWMGYSVNIPTAGTYTVEYRVASLNGGGQLHLEQFGGGSTLGTLNISSTGGWQTWVTLSHEVTFNSGDQDIAIAAISGGWNINWLQISSCSLKSAPSESNITKTNSMSLYPNPATSDISIKGLHEEAKIEVYSITGIKVAENLGYSIDVSELKAGVYILRTNQEGVINQIKFMKK